MTELFPKAILTGFLTLLIIGLFSGLWIILKRKLRVPALREHTLRLSNLGNVPSEFQLQVVSTDPGLYFKLLMGDTPLEEISLPAGPIPVETSPVSAPPSSVQQPITPVKAADVDPIPSGQSALKQARTLVYWLERIASTLPGSAGSWLRQQSQNLGRIQRSASQVDGMQKYARQKARFQNDARTRWIGKSAPQASPAVNKAPDQQGSAVPSLAHYAARTIPVQPGESLELALQISGFQAHHQPDPLTYQVASQQHPLLPIDAKTPQVVRSGIVIFPSITGWRSRLPVLLGGLLICSAAILLGLLIFWIWF